MPALPPLRNLFPWLPHLAGQSCSRRGVGRLTNLNCKHQTKNQPGGKQIYARPR